MVAITIDAVAITGPIRCEDPTVLRNFVRRGQNRILPRTPGRRATSLVLDQLDETLTFRVDGLHDHTGAVNADMETGLEENLEYYRAAFQPTVTITLDYAGDTFTGDAQIPEYAQARTGPISGVIIARVVIPAGQLEP